jgi:hypothetical protein
LRVNESVKKRDSWHDKSVWVILIDEDIFDECWFDHHWKPFVYQKSSSIRLVGLQIWESRSRGSQGKNFFIGSGNDGHE